MDNLSFLTDLATVITAFSAFSMPFSFEVLGRLRTTYGCTYLINVVETRLGFSVRFLFVALLTELFAILLFKFLFLNASVDSKYIPLAGCILGTVAFLLLLAQCLYFRLLYVVTQSERPIVEFILEEIVARRHGIDLSDEQLVILLVKMCANNIRNGIPYAKDSPEILVDSYFTKLAQNHNRVFDENISFKMGGIKNTEIQEVRNDRVSTVYKLLNHYGALIGLLRSNGGEQQYECIVSNYFINLIMFIDIHQLCMVGKPNLFVIQELQYEAAFLNKFIGTGKYLFELDVEKITSYSTFEFMFGLLYELNRKSIELNYCTTGELIYSLHGFIYGRNISNLSVELHEIHFQFSPKDESINKMLLELQDYKDISSFERLSDKNKTSLFREIAQYMEKLNDFVDLISLKREESNFGLADHKDYKERIEVYFSTINRYLCRPLYWKLKYDAYYLLSERKDRVNIKELVRLDVELDALNYVSPYDLIIKYFRNRYAFRRHEMRADEKFEYPIILLIYHLSLRNYKDHSSLIDNFKIYFNSVDLSRDCFGREIDYLNVIITEIETTNRVQEITREIFPELRYEENIEFIKSSILKLITTYEDKYYSAVIEASLSDKKVEVCKKFIAINENNLSKHYPLFTFVQGSKNVLDKIEPFDVNFRKEDFLDIGYVPRFHGIRLYIEDVHDNLARKVISAYGEKLDRIGEYTSDRNTIIIITDTDYEFIPFDERTSLNVVANFVKIEHREQLGLFYPLKLDEPKAFIAIHSDEPETISNILDIEGGLFDLKLTDKGSFVSVVVAPKFYSLI